MFRNYKVYLILTIFCFSVFLDAALSTESPPFILNEWNRKSFVLQLGGKVNVEPNELTDRIGTTEGIIIRFIENQMEVKFTNKDGKTEKGFFNIEDAKEEIAYYKPEDAREMYDRRYDDLDKDSLIYFTTERKIECNQGGFDRNFQDGHPGHKEVCIQPDRAWGTQDFKWKNIKSLKLRPLNRFISRHRDNEQRKNNNQFVDSFLINDEYKCRDLKKYSDNESTFIERCYYVYSPINKYEFFVVVFKDSNYGMYCSKNSKMSVYRIQENHYISSIALPTPQGHGNRVWFVGNCSSSPFSDSFYSQNRVFSWGASQCYEHSITRLRGGYPNAKSYISYRYSQCGKDRNENKIDFKSSCTAYVIENPMNYSHDICRTK